jgi:hypothetical protein
VPGLNRRRFLEYAGVTAVLAGASAIGYDFVRKPMESAESAVTTSENLSGTSTSTSTGGGAGYQRQFPNIAHSDNISIGAHYEPFFTANTWKTHWNPSNGTPLLGQYTSDDELVFSKHVDWATGHGIDFFSFDWFGPQSVNYVDKNVKSYLENPLIRDVQFIIMFDSNRLVGTGGAWDIDDSANRKILEDDFSYIADNYFSHPSYLKLNGRHVLYYWASGGWKGDVQGALEAVRTAASSKGFDPFIIGDPVYFHDPQQNQITPYDAVTQWANYSSTNPNIDQNLESIVEQNYRKWSTMTNQLGKVFIPSVLPGFHKLVNPDWPILPKSTIRLSSQIEIALKYIDPNLRMVLVTTFNDWTEDTNVEPSVEDEFTYLQTIRDKLTGH